MAAFLQNEAVVRGTLAEILANTGASAGLYIGQRGLATDVGVNGLELRYNGTVWVFSNRTQLLAFQHTAVSNDADTLEKVLFTCTVPALGANDILIVRTGWNHTSSANNKILKTKLAGTTLFSTTLTTSAGTVRDEFLRNRGSTSAQVLGLGGTNSYGTGNAAVTTSTVATGVATTFQLTGQKALNTETLTLEFAEVYIHGAS